MTAPVRVPSSTRVPSSDQVAHVATCMCICIRCLVITQPQLKRLGVHAEPAVGYVQLPDAVHKGNNKIKSRAPQFNTQAAAHSIQSLLRSPVGAKGAMSFSNNRSHPWVMNLPGRPGT
jgi:hypothetical protein